MKLYSIDIAIGATAYIRAADEEAAQALADGLRLDISPINFSDGHQVVGEDICVDGRSYGALARNPERIALSPAMTVHGPEEGTKVEFVEELPDA